MKTELILVIYASLTEGIKIRRRIFCENHSISERTFYRYIQQISEFLIKYKPQYFISVSDPDGVYFLEKTSIYNED